MGYLRAKDTVNGALGTCFAIIDGKRHELMQVKNIQAKVKKTRMTIPILGMTAKKRRLGRHRDDDGILCEQFVSQSDGGLYEKRRGYLF